MKQQTLLPLPPSFALLRSCALGLALAATPVLAQNAAPSLDPFADGAAPGSKVIGELNLVNLTLEEAAQSIAQQSGMNILVASEVRDFPVPSMQLRNVTGSGVLRAIVSSGLPILVSETPNNFANEASVWVISASLTATPVANQTRVFNLSSVYIEGVTPADPAAASAPEAFKQLAEVITDAVQETLATRAASTQAKPGNTVIKVHGATRLMIVSGKPEEVDIAKQVVCALGGKSVE